MKSSSKINLPPIPTSIFSKRIPSANNPNELTTENSKEKEKDKDKEKDKEKETKMSTIPMPRYRPSLKNIQKK